MARFEPSLRRRKTSGIEGEAEVHVTSQNDVNDPFETLGIHLSIPPEAVVSAVRERPFGSFGSFEKGSAPLTRCVMCMRTRTRVLAVFGGEYYRHRWPCPHISDWFSGFFLFKSNGDRADR